MCDGTLHAPELEVLAEAAGHFQWSAEKVRALVDEAAARVGGAQTGGSRRRSRERDR